MLLRAFAIVLLALLAGLHAPTARAQEPSLLILVTDPWRKPIQNAQVLAGSAPIAGADALAASGPDGRCTIAATAGMDITVDHREFAPRVMRIEQSDLDRGYITATLYDGGAVSSTVRVGNRPAQTDYVLLQYADPTIYGGFFQARSAPNGSVRFSHMPEGLAYLTAGVRTGGALRSMTLPVQVTNNRTYYAQLALRLGSAAVKGVVLDSDGAPVAAAPITGTIAFTDRSFEELRAETDAAGAFDLTRLAPGILVLRVALPGGDFKRVDVELEAGTSYERTIDFGEGGQLACTLEGGPDGAVFDVFLLEAGVTPDRVQSLTDRARYLRGARAAKLDSTEPALTLTGLSPGAYTALAFARSERNGRVHTHVTAFQPITISEGPNELTLSFDAFE